MKLGTLGLRSNSLSTPGMEKSFISSFLDSVSHLVVNDTEVTYRIIPDSGSMIRAPKMRLMVVVSDTAIPEPSAALR